MSGHRSAFRPIAFVVASLLLFALAGCGDGGGGGGGATTTPPPPVTGRDLNINITSATVGGPPVVNFTVTDKTGAPVLDILAWDLRFNIAKLVPGTNGEPANWQNYLNRAVNGAVQGSEERQAAGYAFGTLVNRGDGNYTYTFAIDITSAAANPCPAPCTTADGRALNISYQPGLTHRVTIQQGDPARPTATGVLDFVPNGGSVSARDIVLTATCNQCHSELTAHVTRIDTRLCVTCHNPGSWVAGAPNTPVDFKVMIHRIHFNIYNSLNPSDPSAPNYMPPTLPSVTAGYPYRIGARDFSRPSFTQDARNCTRCHDSAISAQGDNWKTRPSIAACTSCHDNVYFTTQPDPAKPYQTEPHPAGPATDSSTCALCHGPGRVADVTVMHNFPARFKTASGKFKFNIISATIAGSSPTITFSVTDPSNGDAPYDITTHPAFTTANVSSLALKLGWTMAGKADVGNDSSGQNFGQPISIDALTAAVPGTTAGTFTVTFTDAIPATQTGTLRVMMDGHPAGDVSSTGPTSDDITLPPGAFADRLSVKSVFQDFAISGIPAPRRSVVDIAKCNVCHGTLSLHGNNRTDEPQVCAVCHNPNATDAGRRPSSAGVLTGGVDGKLEEAIDFKTMVHGIHAGQASNGGFREKGITIYGFSGPVDYSKVIFPGKLNDCTVCHFGSSYELAGTWAPPTGNGILATTTTTDPAGNTTTGPAAADAADNLRTSPTTAVCYSCHDGAAVKAHIQDPFNGGQFSATQAQIDAGAENCTFCHGAGRVLNVKAVHRIP